MHINKINDAIFVGSITESQKEYNGSKYVLYKNKLEVTYGEQVLSDNLHKECLSIVYFFCVNDEVFKIGQTSCKTGIKGCLGFYCAAGQDDPGKNRFAINALVREQLRLNNKVDVYMKYKAPIKVNIDGINKSHELVVPLSAKCLEEAHLKDYKEVEGKYPKWNYQEASQPIPAHIFDAFTSYVKKRGETRK